jgi:GNAT superfamily N-acetyltransferase
MLLAYSTASPEDAGECIAMRGKTRQNAISEEQLRSMGITVETWSTAVREGELTGKLCKQEEAIVGYCFGSRKSAEIMVLALLPEYEDKGIAKKLLNLVIQEISALGHTRLHLGCSANPNDRSHGFYRHLGWASTGEFDSNGDEILFLIVNRSGAAARDA